MGGEVCVVCANKINGLLGNASLHWLQYEQKRYTTMWYLHNFTKCPREARAEVAAQPRRYRPQRWSNDPGLSDFSRVLPYRPKMRPPRYRRIQYSRLRFPLLRAKAPPLRQKSRNQGVGCLEPLRTLRWLGRSSTLDIALNATSSPDPALPESAGDHERWNSRRFCRFVTPARVHTQSLQKAADVWSE